MTSNEHYYPQTKISLRNRAYDSSYMKFVERLRTQYYNYLYKTEQYSRITDDDLVLELISQLEGFQKENKGNFWLITFNPPEYKDLCYNQIWQRLLETVEKCIGYKNLLGNHYACVLEQRSEDYKSIYGLHAHLLIQVGKEPKSQVRIRCHKAMLQCHLDC